MNSEEIRLIQSSWNEIAGRADTVSKAFYARLFAVDPAICPLFQGVDMTRQRGRLMHMIDAAVNGLDDLDALVPTLNELGRRHVDYGVQDKHYDAVGDALLWALDRSLGAGWTQALAEAWSRAYALLAGVMRDGAATPVSPRT